MILLQGPDFWCSYPKVTEVLTMRITIYLSDKDSADLKNLCAFLGVTPYSYATKVLRQRLQQIQSAIEGKLHSTPSTFSDKEHIAIKMGQVGLSIQQRNPHREMQHELRAVLKHRKMDAD